VVVRLVYWTLLVANWLVTAGLVVAVLALARQIGLIHRRLPPQTAKALQQGPQVGQVVPAMDGADLDGRRVSLSDKMWTLLVFVTPSCSTCSEMVPIVQELARAEKSRLSTIFFSVGSQEATRRFIEANPIDVPVVASVEIADRFGVYATPYAMVIDQSGVLRAAGLFNTVEQLESVLLASDASAEAEFALNPALAPS
jgi:methylamine dehydrogenase accessory protein MauD